MTSCWERSYGGRRGGGWWVTSTAASWRCAPCSVSRSRCVGPAPSRAACVSSYGEPLRRPIGAVTHAFPSAAALAQADPDRLAMPLARRRALVGLAGALAGDQLVLDAGADRADARRRLLALPGIGPWTAEYIAMRALRDPDAFLPSDLGVRHALERLGQDGRPAAVEKLSERWRPYRAYALFHLWGSLRQPGSATRASSTARDRGRLAA